MALPQKGNLARVLSMRSLQAESIFPMAHNEEKNKAQFFMFHPFSCQNGRIYIKTREKNVFVKPNEQCRACSNIVTARKRTFRGTRKERFR